MRPTRPGGAALLTALLLAAIVSAGGGAAPAWPVKLVAGSVRNLLGAPRSTGSLPEVPPGSTPAQQALWGSRTYVCHRPHGTLVVPFETARALERRGYEIGRC